ncbi:MAG: PTS sugar transporter subunit IIB [Longicatena sp.]
MLNILLICSAGMSTSLMVAKMQKVSEEIGFESNIWAVATDSAVENMEKADVILLGPQIRFMLDGISEKAKKFNIPVAVINFNDYGTCNGKAILIQALNLKKAGV